MWIKCLAQDYLGLCSTQSGTEPPSLFCAWDINNKSNNNFTVKASTLVMDTDQIKTMMSGCWSCYRLCLITTLVNTTAKYETVHAARDSVIYSHVKASAIMISIYYVKDVAMQLVHVKNFIYNHAYCTTCTLHNFYLSKHCSTLLLLHACSCGGEFHSFHCSFLSSLALLFLPLLPVKMFFWICWPTYQREKLLNVA